MPLETSISTLKATKYILLASLLIVPFAVLSPGPAVHSQRLAISFAGWMVLASLIDNKYVKAFIVYMTAWQAWLCVSALYFGGDKVQVLMGVSSLNRVMWAILAMYAVSISGIKKEWFFNVVCVISLVQAVITIFQAYDINPYIAGIGEINDHVLGKPEAPTTFGTFGLVNALSTWLGVTIVFFYRKWWFFCVPVIVYALFKTNCILAIITPAVATIIWSWRYSRVIVLASVPTAIVALTYSWKQVLSEAGTRPENWSAVIEYMAQSKLAFLFGFGPGHEVPLFPIHNEYLGLLFIGGMVALFIVVGFLLSLNWSDRIMVSSCGALCFDSFLNYCMHVPPTAFFGVFLFGMMGWRKNGYVEK